MFSSDGEGRKKIIITVVLVVLFPVLIIMMVISLPGVLIKGLSGEDISQLDYKQFTLTEDAIKNNPIYTKIRYSYVDYLDDLDYDFDKKVEKIKKEHTYEEISYKDVLDEDGKVIDQEEVRETIVPEVIKTIIIAKPELRQLIAYISVKHLQEDNTTYTYNPNEGKKFLKDITEYVESISGQDPIYYYASTTILEANEIAVRYFKETEYGEDYQMMQDMYIASFESMEDFNDGLVGSAYEFIDLSTLNIHGSGMKIPHMLQYDPKWGKHKYGNGSIAKSGCAIVSMAMVQSYLKNAGVLPDGIADWSQSHGYYKPGAGTDWSFFSSYSSSVGITCQNLGKDAQKLIKALEGNNPVIASMSPGTFTSAGHFIVLRGITDNGKILVNDPNDNYYSKKFYEKEFDINHIYSESKNFWSFR